MAFWSKARVPIVCLLVLCASAWLPGQGHLEASEDFRALPLRDQEGKATSLRAFEGRTMVVHFIFTHCLSACHLQVLALRQVRELLTADTKKRVQFVSVSIDPEHDTPDTLRRYAQANGIVDADWRFATASPAVIGQITEQLGIKRQPVADGQIDHTLAVFLFDATGRLVQRYSGAEVDTARLAREIDAVVSLFGAPRASH